YNEISNQSYYTASHFTQHNATYAKQAVHKPSSRHPYFQVCVPYDEASLNACRFAFPSFLRVTLSRLFAPPHDFSFSYSSPSTATSPSFIIDVIGGPSEGVASFSQENRSPNRVVSGTDSSSQDDLLSSSSSGEVFPFEIWYRDNSEDDNSDDPFSWVDPNVKSVSSLYIQGSSMLGMAKKLCQPNPWSVVVRSCRSNESVNNQPSPDEAPFFFFYEPVFSKLGIKLPFTAFEQSILRALNVASSQLHPNSWAFKVAKVGWMSLSDRPRRKLLKPFLESFKTFKDKFFKIGQGKTGPNILADQSGTPYFPLY
ncbi:hypothetical protein CR513_14189, partial [Mucuna pruriens]